MYGGGSLFCCLVSVGGSHAWILSALEGLTVGQFFWGNLGVAGLVFGLASAFQV